MKIDLHKITIRKVIVGYKDSAEEGVVAYDGKLDIRPKYQREFVYKEKQRNAVIETIKNSFPLNVMYWMIREDGGYEVLDGQQRTISIGQYVNGDFSLNDRFFHNLTKEEQDKILDYELKDRITPENFAEFLSLVYTNKINNLAAGQILEAMFATGQAPTEIMEEKSLGQIDDTAEIETAINAILAANPKAIEDYKAGKEASFKFLVGQAMRELKGKANPAIINEMLLKKLS